MTRRALAAIVVAGALCAGPACARDTLGVWNDWGAFRDAAVPRCYAIAMASETSGRTHDTQPFMTIATWPRREVHGEVRVRLSHLPAPGRPVVMAIGAQRYRLAGGGIDVWAADRRMDAAIIAGMRAGGALDIYATARTGRRVRDTYRLAGAASALDAASLGCTP